MDRLAILGLFALLLVIVCWAGRVVWTHWGGQHEHDSDDIGLGEDAGGPKTDHLRFVE